MHILETPTSRLQKSKSLLTEGEKIESPYPEVDNFIKEFLLIQKSEQNVIFLNKDERKQKSDGMTNEH